MRKKILIMVNGPAYGADETYNAVRLANALARRDDAEVVVFLMGDAVTCAIAGQRTPRWLLRAGSDAAKLRPARRPDRVLRHLPGRARAHQGAADRGGGAGYPGRRASREMLMTPQVVVALTAWSDRNR